MGKILTYLREEGVEVAVLTESHFTFHRVGKILEMQGDTIWATNAPNEYSCGVTIVILNKHRVANQDLSITTLDGEGRWLGVKFTYCGKPISMMGVYAPNPETESVQFLEKLGDEIRTHQPMIVAGDWNKTSLAMDRNPARTEDFRILRSLRNAVDPANYKDGWRKTHQNDLQFTYWAVNALGSASRIDRIYVSNCQWGRTSKWDIEIKQPWTDHAAATTVYAIGGHIVMGPGYWRMNVDIAKSPQVTKNLGRYVTENLSEAMTGVTTINSGQYYELNEGVEPQNVMNRVEIFLNGLRDTVQSNQQRLIRKRKRAKQKIMKKIIQLDQKPRLTAKQGTRLKSLKVRLDAHNNAMNRNRQLRGFRKVIESSAGNTAQFWRRLRNRPTPQLVEAATDHNGKIRTTQKRIMRVYKKYYKQLYTSQGSNNKHAEKLIKLLPRSKKWWVVDRHIGRDDIKIVLAKWKSGRAPGHRGIPYELYKRFADAGAGEEESALKLIDMLALYANIVLNPLDFEGVTLPHDWQKSVIKILYKKGDPTLPKNYRPLSLADPLLKLVTGIITFKAQLGFDDIIGTHQTGFMPGRNIHDNIMHIQSIIDLAQSRGEEVYICFLDQEKAYDRVEHEYLWKCLEQIGFPLGWIKCLQTMAQSATAAVEINGEMSELFRICRGLRQGDPLSCPLYNVAIEPLALAVKGCKELPGFKDSQGNTHKISMYADDTALILTAIPQWRVFKKIYSRYAKASGQKLNLDKTCIMAINAPPNTPTMLEDGVKVINGIGNTVKHLGVPVGVDVDYSPMWKSRMEKIKNTLRGIESRAKHLSRFQRVAYANQALEGSLTHFLRVCYITDREITQFMRVIHRFVHQTKPEVKVCRGPIAHNQTYRRLQEGGLGLLDIRTMRKALTLKWAATLEEALKTKKRPIWYYIVQETMQRCSVYREAKDLVVRPWMKFLGKGATKFPPSIKAWVGQWDYHKSHMVKPPNLRGILALDFWFHPDLNYSGSVQPRWHARCWKEMRRGTGLPSRILKLGDLIEIANKRVPQTTQTQQRAAATFLENMPDVWYQEFVKAADVNWRKGVNEICDVPKKYRFPLKQNAAQQMYGLYSPWTVDKNDRQGVGYHRLSKWVNHDVYNFLLPFAHRDPNDIQKMPIDNLTNFKIACNQDRTNITRVTDQQIWNSVISRSFDRPKLSDLLWGINHGVLATGLDWMPNGGKCPQCNTVQLTKHLFWDCVIAQKVYQNLKVVWKLMARPSEKKKLKFPHTWTGMLLYSIRKKGGSNSTYNERWRLLWGNAMWAIWKERCKWSFQEKACMVAEDAVREFQSLVLIEVESRRIVAIDRSDPLLSKEYSKLFGHDARDKAASSFLKL